MSSTPHFDRRGSTYDADETHRRILDLLVSGAPLRPGMRVLDIATGTGAAALRAAEIVGPHGSVLGIDLSEGMLEQARRKATTAGLHNVEFLHADAEHCDFPSRSFDFLFCASGLVLMRDIPAALRLWACSLKPGGFLAFDTPAKPFGLSQRIAEAAAAHGVLLPYDTVADTPVKCRALLEQAGLEARSIQTEIVSDTFVEIPDAIHFLDERLDHPAWRALKDAPQETRIAVRTAFLANIRENAVADRLQVKVVQNFVYGRKAHPAEKF